MLGVKWHVALFFAVFLSLSAFASPDIASFSDVEALLDRVPAGRGSLVLTVESFSGKNPKRISQVADRVEVWLGARRIASMDAESEESVIDGHRRTVFPLPAIDLEAGYYFITVRLYRRGSFSARSKWQGETFQIGIHPGRVTRIHKSIPIFLW